ncbi:MAG: histidine kinase [Lachnospiraceae bacterium]|nr:histidine kinase [Lachnospiraceae bacterium]
MTRKKDLCKRPIFLRVILAFLLVLILFFFLYLGIYMTGYRIITSEISEALYTGTSNVMDTFEEEIDRIQTLQYECLNEEILYYTINAWGILSTSEKVQGMLDILDRLDILQKSSPYIEEAILDIPGLGRVISSQEGVVLSDEWEDAFWREQENLWDTLIYGKEGSIYMTASYPINWVQANGSSLYTLVLLISEQELENELEVLCEYVGGGVMLAAQNSQYSLSTGEKLDLTETELKSEAVEGTAIKKMRDAASGKRYSILFTASSYLRLDLFTYIPDEEIYRELNVYREIFVVFLFLLLDLFAFLVVALHLLINRPIQILVDSLREMEREELSVRIPADGREDEFGYVFAAFNRMAESMQHIIEINYRQKILVKQAELRHLQAQINPHFLYNSFFSIYRMARDEDYDDIVAFSKYLSDYYRYITKSAQAEMRLEEEVKHAMRYAQIQEMRFGRRIKVQFEELPAQCAALKVPRLILQPVLENSFAHGLCDIEKGGLLRIWYELKEGRLYIHVEDNGIGMTEEELETLREKMEQTGELVENGLSNIHQRIRIKFGKEFGIRIVSSEGEGTCCTLVLPMEDIQQKGKKDVPVVSGG